MTKRISIILLLFTVYSCDFKQQKGVDVSAVQVQFSIDRFDVDFYKSTQNTLAQTKEKYPFFFSSQEPDSIWMAKIHDVHEKELFAESQKLYADVSFLEKELELLFKHITYYNPGFKTPKVITLLSNIDAQNKVVYTKDYLLISLDVYLGETHRFYADYPKYIKQNFTKDRIIVDVAKIILSTGIKATTDRTFIGKMIHEGVQLQVLDAYIPEVSETNKIGYSEVKFQWAKENEEEVWKYFIENKLLFSTETKLNKRFIDEAPFSKFYRSEDNRSPGRIGAWMGWQIVKSYMQYNDVSLQKLIQTSPEEIYNKSKYKPKK